jgi:hypothetical protein
MTAMQQASSRPFFGREGRAAARVGRAREAHGLRRRRTPCPALAACGGLSLPIKGREV